MIKTYQAVPISQYHFCQQMNAFISQNPPPDPISPQLEIPDQSTVSINNKLRALLCEQGVSRTMAWRDWVIRFEVTPLTISHQRDWPQINVVIECKPEYDDYLTALLQQGETWLAAAQ